MKEWDEKCFIIGAWVIQPTLCQLIRCEGDTCINVEPKVVEILAYMSKNPNRIVTRDELSEHVWANTVASDNSINRTISLIRKYLEDDIKFPKYIRTIPKRGYLLLAIPEFPENVKQLQKGSKIKLEKVPLLPLVENTNFKITTINNRSHEKPNNQTVQLEMNMPPMLMKKFINSIQDMIEFLNTSDNSST
ncbi:MULTISPECIES: winged helix-turn-helix domain-containing protein [unclassified Colwellia]|uniref:winged helix-turn-helix domain-containing protein n=1 Tax=unclassified Colwellia TaxID=196834 RepID=UPI0015F6BB12|nr:MULTISPECIES: winged helix-turn-helix domain-containing protein [unclassified Colwellia]MBA6257664.1 winged helix-turn-helix domain-containing protein [Colwellia sp. MB3u-28]MBA6259421.1 winged helix-turn-helix domain-containing protein [Colwellia sp. MB3u-41]MBA6304376.1 winged helix-turn-helix domain-containing protein [Colwellia sp. MB02u-14]